MNKNYFVVLINYFFAYTNKHLCILVTLIFCSGADYQLFFIYLGQICIKFMANLASKFKNYAERAPSHGAIYEEFS